MKRNIKILFSVVMMMTLVMMMTPSVMADDIQSAQNTDTTSQNQAVSSEAQADVQDQGQTEAQDQGQTNIQTNEPEEADTTSAEAASSADNNKPEAQTKESTDSKAVSKNKEKEAVKVEKPTIKALAYNAFDSSTTLSDGSYIPTGVVVSGGSGKVTITCPEISVKSGKAYAMLVFSSKYYTKLKVDGVSYDSTNVGTTSVFTVPADLNSEMEIVGTTMAMSEAHDITYSINISLAEPAEDPGTSVVDNSTSIPDAVYKPDLFKYTGGTGKVAISCSKITINGGKAFATIVFGSQYYTKLKASGRIYDGDIDTTVKTSTYVIPIELNSDNTVIGTTTAMSEAHDITYTIRAELTADSVKITDSGSKDPSSGDGKDNDTKIKKLKNGTYKIRTEVAGKMFYIYPKDSVKHYSILTVKNGKYNAVITLDGQGYNYVYMGTAPKAEKAAKSSWVKYKTKNGFYSYKIPVSKLDKNLDISAHSKKYNKWYGERTIKFYSGTAKKVKAGTTTTGNKKSSYKIRSGKSAAVSAKAATYSVDNVTTLKDGAYLPDSFSWSGGSGRLAYIRCSKITVTNGRAYATIAFSSSSYDRLKASGSIYTKNGSGMSTFVIPVRLNGNNTIIGRTVAMSQAHWIRYSIYVSKAESGFASASGETTLSTDKMPGQAPAITGLTYKSTTKIEKAKYFKIYKYDHGITLIVMDLSKNTDLYKEAVDLKSSEHASDKAQYDEEGNLIAKTPHEITEGLYQNNIVNYLVVPKGYDVPAGLDKKCIIIEKPAKNAYVTSEEAADSMDSLDVTDKIGTIGMSKSKVDVKSISKALDSKAIKYAGSYKSPDYSVLVRNKVKLCILPSDILPEKVTGRTTGFFASSKAKKAAAESKADKKMLKALNERFTALDVPVIVDRSENEKTRLAKEEWIKLYGAVYGCEKKADKIFNKEVKNEK